MRIYHRMVLMYIITLWLLPFVPSTKGAAQIMASNGDTVVAKHVVIVPKWQLNLDSLKADINKNVHRIRKDNQRSDSVINVLLEANKRLREENTILRKQLKLLKGTQ